MRLLWMPGELVLGELVPGELALGELVLGELVLGELVLGELVPGEAVPAELMPAELMPAELPPAPDVCFASSGRHVLPVAAGPESRRRSRRLLRSGQDCRAVGVS